MCNVVGFWHDILRLIEEHTFQTPRIKIIITGDLNTRDKRFGRNHSENHSYLDEFLANMQIINNIDIPTRGDNVLDITLANDNAEQQGLAAKFYRN